MLQLLTKKSETSTLFKKAVSTIKKIPTFITTPRELNEKAYMTEVLQMCSQHPRKHLR